MKKLICLLLVVVMICTVLSGCELSGIFGTTTSTTPKRIEPSERDAILDELELDYTDNFDEYDIEFVKCMRVVQHSLPGYDERPNFAWAMQKMSRETDTFYKLNIDFSNELYFISVYELNGKSLEYTLEYGGVIEWVKWCKYDNYDDIPSEVDGGALIGAYAVYDCVVEKDILNNVIYNHSCKYYVPLPQGYSKVDYIDVYNLYDLMVWADLSKIFGRTTPITILHTFNIGFFLGKDIYRYSVDENGVEYLDGASIQSIVDEYWKK